MAVDKALTQMPVGIEEMAQQMMGEPDIEVEIEDPEAVRIRADGLEIEIEPGKQRK